MTKKFVAGYGEKKGTWTSMRYDLSGRGPGSAPVRVRRKRLGDGGGISFQFPHNYDDGSGKFKHLPEGHPFAGRVYFTNRREAQELAKRHAGKTGEKISFDPN